MAGIEDSLKALEALRRRAEEKSRKKETEEFEKWAKAKAQREHPELIRQYEEIQSRPAPAPEPTPSKSKEEQRAEYEAHKYNPVAERSKKKIVIKKRPAVAPVNDSPNEFMPSGEKVEHPEITGGGSVTVKKVTPGISSAAANFQTEAPVQGMAAEVNEMEDDKLPKKPVVFKHPSKGLRSLRNPFSERQMTLRETESFKEHRMDKKQLGNLTRESQRLQARMDELAAQAIDVKDTQGEDSEEYEKLKDEYMRTRKQFINVKAMATAAGNNYSRMLDLNDRFTEDQLGTLGSLKDSLKNSPVEVEPSDNAFDAAENRIKAVNATIAKNHRIADIDKASNLYAAGIGHSDRLREASEQDRVVRDIARAMRKGLNNTHWGDLGKFGNLELTQEQIVDWFNNHPGYASKLNDWVKRVFGLDSKSQAQSPAMQEYTRAFFSPIYKDLGGTEPWDMIPENDAALKELVKSYNDSVSLEDAKKLSRPKGSIK